MKKLSLLISLVLVSSIVPVLLWSGTTAYAATPQECKKLHGTIMRWDTLEKTKNGKDCASDVSGTNCQDIVGDWMAKYPEVPSSTLGIIGCEIKGDMKTEAEQAAGGESGIVYQNAAANELCSDINSKRGKDECSIAVMRDAKRCLGYSPLISNKKLPKLDFDWTAKCITAFSGYASAKDSKDIARTAAALKNAEKNAEKTYNETKNRFDEKDENGSESSCNIDGIGWIVCPVMTFMGTINDLMYNAVSKMLVFEASKFADKDLLAAWSSFRNIANVLFVLAFLLIIYSQMTSVGMTNYGLKKLLPKLIVAAILVNISFWLCAIAVDISNILGASLKSFFDQLATSGGDEAGGTGIGGVVVGALVTSLLAAGLAAAAVGAVLAVSVPVLLAAALAIIMIIVILMARQALLIILIVISPVAFVAYLLPNTEQWFKKWMKLFGSLLMLYPVVAVVFGASAFAGRLISNTAGGDYLLQLTAIGVATLPLIFVPSLLKNSLNATGALGAKLSGFSGQANRLTGRLGKDAAKRNAKKYEARMANSERTGRLGDALRMAGGYRTRRAFDRRSQEAATARQQGQALSRHVLNNPQRYDDEVVDQMFDEEVKRSLTAQRNWSMDDVAQAAATGTHNGQQLSETDRSAAIQRTMESGGFGQRRAVIENLGGASREVQQRAIKGIYSKGDQNIYGADIGDRILDGTVQSAKTLQQQAIKNAAAGNVTAEHLADTGSGTSWLIETALTNQPNKAARDNLGTAAGEVVANEATRRKLTGDHTRAFGKL